MFAPFLLFLGVAALAGLILFLFYPIFMFCPRPNKDWFPFWFVLLLGCFTVGAASTFVDSQHRSIVDILFGGFGGILVIPLLLGALFGIIYWLYRFLLLLGFISKSTVVKMKSLAQHACSMCLRFRNLPRTIRLVILITLAVIATAYIILRLPRQGRYQYTRDGIILDTRTGDTFSIRERWKGVPLRR